MREALRFAYPPGSSMLRRVLGPVVDPWTYLRGAHLVAMFPLGIGYFVALVVGLSLGLSLSWTLLGPPLLLVVMYVSRWGGDAEAWVVRHLHRMELRRPPTTIERGSYRSQVWARIIDPTTWTGLVYLFVQFPLGIVLFVLLVVLSSVGAAFVVAPLASGTSDLDVVIRQAAGTEWWLPYVAASHAVIEARWPLPFIGGAVLLAELHLVNLLSAAHAWWARLMLGSRAPHIVPGAPLGDLPPGPDDGPMVPGEPIEGEPAAQPLELDVRQAQARGFAASAAHLDASTVAPVLMPGGPLDTLTPRELEVLRLIARGYSNAEIAEAFVVSEGTVKTHVKRVLAKLEVRDRTQAAVWAFDHGFVRPVERRNVAAEAEAPEPLRLRAPR